MPQPVKRGPVRPRKYPLSGPAAPAPVEEPAAPVDEFDPRIGMDVHPDATHVGFDDGSQYRAEGGLIVEKLN